MYPDPKSDEFDDKTPLEIEDQSADEGIEFLDGFQNGFMLGYERGFDDGIEQGYLNALYRIRALYTDRYDEQLTAIIDSLIGE